MATATIRELLHRQIDVLPDEVVQQIADFALFVAARRKIGGDYVDWDAEQWEKFAIEQFFRDTDDDVVYTFNDAKEIYRP